MLYLPSEPFTVLDLQTSAPTPGHGDIIEVGWQTWDGSHFTASEHFLVSTPDHNIAKRIQRLTGLSSDELATGLPLEMAIKKLRSLLAEGRRLIIYFEQFEKSFLAKYLPEENFTTLCLFRFAKLMHPYLPSHSLKSVASHCNYSLPPQKRTEHHVAASIQVFTRLYEDYTQQYGPSSLTELQSWMQSYKPALTAKTFRSFGFDLPDLPDSPGVYQMFDQNQQLLYIGKASNLKSRVKSYFIGKKTKGSRLNEMICRVRSLQITPLPTPHHAALVEASMIKALSPSYNIALKTDSLDASEPIFVDRQLSGMTSDPALGLCGPFFDRPYLEFLTSLSQLWKGVALEGLSVFQQQEIDWQFVQGIVVDLKNQFKIPQTKSFWYFCLFCRKIQREAEAAHDVNQTNLGLEKEVEEEALREVTLEETMAKLITRSCAEFARRILEMRACRFLQNCEIKFFHEATGQHVFRVRQGIINLETVHPTLDFVKGSRNARNDWDLLRVLLSVVKQLSQTPSSQLLIRSDPWTFDQQRLQALVKY